MGGVGLEKPILFSTEMVKAILAGKKTMTRRVINPQPSNPYWCGIGHGWDDGHGYEIKCPYGQPGYILWVRETWCRDSLDGTTVYHKANFTEREIKDLCTDEKWKPSIHMPRAAARLFLTVTNIRVERLQDITEEDARAEGIREFNLVASNGTTKLYGVKANQPEMAYNARDAFQDLWESINASRGYGWEVNPWVWVVEFERVEL